MLQICSDVKTYCDLVTSGSVEASKEIKNCIKNLIYPLFGNKNIYWDDETYIKSIKFMETYFYDLFPYQKFVFAMFFIYKDKSKREPLFHTIQLIMGRGNGKDGLIVPLLLFLTTHYYGIRGYDIDIVANSEKQAKDSYDVIYNVLQENSKLMRKFFRWTKTEIISIKTQSKIRFNASNAKTKDGKRPGLVFFNEYHQYENYDNITVHTSGLGKKPHSRTIIVSTDGYVRGGPFDALKETANRILEGGLIMYGTLPLIFKLDDEVEMEDERMWVKANPSIEYMSFLKSEIRKNVFQAKDHPHLKAEILTKRFNIPRQNEDEIFATWELIQKAKHPVVKKGFPLAICGIDFAELRDFASAGFLWEIDGIYQFMQHTWINKNSPFFHLIKPDLYFWQDKGYCTIVETPMIDIEVILDWITLQAQEFELQVIVTDYFRWELMRPKFEERGLYEITRKEPYNEVSVIRSGSFTQEKVSPILDDLFYNNKLWFGEDDMMAWFINNTGVHRDKNGNKRYIKIEEKTRKNDGFMALVHCCTEIGRLKG